MSWEDQGRQQHGWFGSGKGEATNNDSAASDGQSLSQRVDAVIAASIAALPRALRAPMELRLDTATRANLNTLLVTWSRGAGLDRAEFAGQFFGREANDPVAVSLRTAALTARLSDGLRDAAEYLASAMETVGLDRWHRFLNDAQVRSNEPSTIAALEPSQTHSDSPRDAIRPVYPVETAIGIAAAGVAGGGIAATRAAGVAVWRQFLPKRPAVQTEPPSLRSSSGTSNNISQPAAKESGPLQNAVPQARVTPSGRTHILDGEGEVGGHRPGTGTPGKSEFPTDWSDQKIIDEVESVANDPASTRSVQSNGRTRVEGSRDNVRIRVIVNPDGLSIRTAHPINVPLNPPR